LVFWNFECCLRGEELETSLHAESPLVGVEEGIRIEKLNKSDKPNVAFLVFVVVYR